MNKIKLILGFLIFTNSLFASHVAGGYISYEPTAKLNQYIVTAVFFRDCRGINAPLSINLIVRNDCGLINPSSSSLQLDKDSSYNKSQLCTSQLQNSTCNGGSVPGVEMHVYKGIITLSGACKYWTLSYQVNARTSMINIIGGAFYIKTTLNNLDYPYNNSPVLSSKYPNMIIDATTSNSTTISLGIIDYDNDSLRYSFNGGLNDFDGKQYDSLDFISPYSSKSPMPGISINSNTGNITIPFSFLGKWTIPIMVEEFDNKGIPIDTTLFEFVYTVDHISNINPKVILNSIIFDQQGTKASLINNETISMCDGDQFCLEVTFSDANINDSLLISSDDIKNIPGATIVQTGYNPATAKVCMSYSSKISIPSFTIYAEDDNCPILGVASKSFIINTPIIHLVNDTLYQCGNATNQIIKSNPNKIYWTNLTHDTLKVSSEISCNPCLNPIFNLASGTTVIAKNGKFDCNNGEFLTIINGNPNAKFASDTTTICNGDTISFVAPNPNSINIWSGSKRQNKITFQPKKSEYFGLQTESNGCFAKDSTFIFIDSAKVPLINLSSIGLTADPYISYQWYYNNILIIGENKQSIIPKYNGPYHVEISNSSGCKNISDVFEMKTVQVNSFQQLTEFSINRIENELMVSSKIKNSQLYVFDLSGRKILESNLQLGFNQINLPNNNSLYILKILSDKSNLTIIK